jgi:hypothetical protein
MKLIEVNFKYNTMYASKDLLPDRVKWDTEYSLHDSYTKNMSKEEKKVVEIEYRKMSIEEAIVKYPKSVKAEGNITLTQAEFEKAYSLVEVKGFIDVATDTQLQAIDLNKLATRITDSLIGTQGDKLFNNRLEIHQPNMPLFTYNKFINLDDCCTEKLQDDYIDEGWRVVAVIPQPDQRRPDYIVGKYIKDSDGNS